MSIKIIFHGRTHKENESINDCQDYFQVNPENNCFAITDGASQSFYPSIWAELLVNHFCQNPDINPNNWTTWLQPIQEKWLLEVEKRIIKAKNENSPVWVTNQNRLNFHESATSTFIGLQFIADKLKLSLVGDSCLFIVEGDQSGNKYQLTATYLLKASKDFNDRPGYFASYPKDNQFQPAFYQLSLNQTISTNNTYLLLATDALAEYIFKCVEHRFNIFETLLSISASQDKFESFVTSARNAQSIKMKNDDVTLLILSIPNSIIYPSSLETTHEKEGNTQPFQYLNYKQSEIEDNSYLESTETSKRHHELSQDKTECTTPIINQNYPQINASFNNLIPHIWYRLISSILSHNITHKSITKVQISNDELVLRINELQEQNSSLKRQRIVFVLGILLLPLWFFIHRTNTSNSDHNQINTTTASTKYVHKFIRMKEEISIYKDQNFTDVIVQSLSNSPEVLILEEGGTWIKFQTNFYAYTRIVDKSCENCRKGEVKINADKIRLLPIPHTQKEDLDKTLLGKLEKPSIFEEIEFDAVKDWYKLRLEGYIKKKDIQ
ncbi:hypothetical protein B6N60_02772 [Richelia sinica FACHB-800]|uniref:Uncharacterized protein n=1 Tax=Richelia sinica FACHB-800 TaxID=1357546 RepID=A0A975T8N0_9NOST|nr:protein phosphatase 2C family protein [Richelia sinica]MBD2665401.1 protein phosphatase 2C family protein [Richelia sinica FACHB-800]QXE24069.1 hypothetical protein B6N60_02772 [Richelia sinica FACHB-800]